MSQLHVEEDRRWSDDEVGASLLYKTGMNRSCALLAISWPDAEKVGEDTHSASDWGAHSGEVNVVSHEKIGGAFWVVLNLPNSCEENEFH